LSLAGKTAGSKAAARTKSTGCRARAKRAAFDKSALLAKTLIKAPLLATKRIASRIGIAKSPLLSGEGVSRLPVGDRSGAINAKGARGGAPHLVHFTHDHGVCIARGEATLSRELPDGENRQSSSANESRDQLGQPMRFHNRKPPVGDHPAILAGP
jgi:hypothetical protein